ncbi:MAG: TAXI family TRAP transporter solute-binding subunit [Burkholderiales bacterium]
MGHTRRTSAAVLLATALLVACSPSGQRLKLATGPQGGTWYPLGGAIKSIVETQMGDVSMQVLPGGGIANVLAVERGRAHVALANSVSTVDAINAQPPFRTQATQVCNVATLYPQYFQVITLADAGLRSPEDFRGKVLGTQMRGNTGEAITAHMLKAFAMTYQDLAGVSYGSYTDSVTLMKDGNADFFTIGTSIPASAVMDLASARDVHLVSVPEEGIKRMQALNPGYERVEIPIGTYPKQDQPVVTIGYWTHIIARCDLADDIVYRMLDSLYKRLDDLAAIARAVRKATPQSMGREIGVPMHPGAARWYGEQRVTPGGVKGS